MSLASTRPLRGALALWAATAAACAVGVAQDGAGAGVVQGGGDTGAPTLTAGPGGSTGGGVPGSTGSGPPVDTVPPPVLPPAIVCPAAVDPSRELVVTALTVVEDPCRTQWRSGQLTDAADGAWHFGRLLTEMAGVPDPKDPDKAARFTEAWLRSFSAVQTIGGANVTDSDSSTETPDAPRPARGKVFGAGDLLSVWPRTLAGTLDMTQPPLLLLAVVNRIDQRDPSRGKLGELRFVFQGEVCSAIGGLPNACLPGTTAYEARVILEYSVPTGIGFADATAWAAAWHALPDPAVAPAAYVAGLTALTHAVTAANAAPGRPNGSAIGQVRTSQVNPATVPWVYRQFELDAGSGLLVGKPLALTPGRALDDGAALQGFLVTNRAAISSGVYTLPAATLPEGGASGMSGGLQPDGTYTADFITSSSWGLRLGATVDPTARYVFSLNTCNGCHGAETANNVSTAHILRRHVGQASGLSTLFTGVGAGVVGSQPLPLATARLGELARRQADMQAVLCAGAGATVGPLNVVP